MIISVPTSNIRYSQATISYNGIVNHVTNRSSGDTYTATNIPTGTASSDRLVVMAIRLSGSGEIDISNVQIAGSTATYVDTGDETSGYGIFYANVSTGTVTTVAVPVGAGTADNCLFASWSVKNYHHAHPFYSGRFGLNDGSSATSLSGSLLVPAGGVAIALSGRVSTSNATTWTGMTEDFEHLMETNAKATGASLTTTSKTNYIQDVDLSFTSSTYITTIYASWR